MHLEFGNEVCTFFRRSAKGSNILKNRLKVLKEESNKNVSTLIKYCETRWVERHESVSLFADAFSCIVLALEDIQAQDKDDQGNAQALHLAICRFSFIIALKISERITYKLSQYLQSTFIDLCTALDSIKEILTVVENIRANAESDSIKEILTVVENIRANAESDFRKFFVKIENEFGVEPTIPRQVGSQRHRDNYPGATPEEYFRTSIFVPFVDDLRASLIERFVTHQTTLASLQTVMPRNIINSNFDSIKPAL
ncbi:hypothetical protein QE152_g25564 [Popillia japonica]|uniref:Uncharacterized protein n=1 Tax=Popillia japonica TaxID=7064 RepID=A0AAW1K0P6_POPJA